MTQKQRSIALYSVAALLLAIPFVAMKFSSEVRWTLSDFAVGGLLLFSTAFSIDWVLKKFKQQKQRIIICLAVLIIAFLVWAELAVGIFGSIFAGS